MSGVEDAFDDLADQVSVDAAAIDCSPSDYREGLRGIISRLQADIAASLETAPEEEE